MNIRVDAIGESLVYAIKYLPETLKLIFIPLTIGLLIGTVTALIRVYRIPVLSQFLALFITIYQGIPIVVALFLYNILFLMKFNDIFEALHITKTIADIDSIWIGIFALTMSAVCTISEVMRGTLLSIDKGQNEAGFAVGLTKVQIVRRIILPQVVPVAIPPLVNSIVGLIKGSSIVYVIGIAEVLSGALIPSARRYTFFEGYLAAALVYWGLTVIIEKLGTLIEEHSGKFRRSL